MRFTEEELAQYYRDRGMKVPAEARAPVEQIPDHVEVRVREDLEHEYACTVMEWVELHKQAHPDLEYLYAIPNAGKRTGRERGRLIAEGLKSGVSDWHLPVGRGGFIGLWLELKTETGVVSPAQLWWLAEMQKKGHAGFVVRGVDETLERLIWYLRLPPTIIGLTPPVA